ncbi:MAG: hypothetical protein PHI67_08550 [Candidatus Methanomethylophilaceae archaeon]|nr:hypothetical protein [Candidatus Methanomethylophilaceae archaeon]
MKTIYLIIDSTERDEDGKGYRGDCRGLTESLEVATTMLAQAKKDNPGRKIHKKSFKVSEVEIWHSDETIEHCIITPVYRPPDQLLEDEEE